MRHPCRRAAITAGVVAFLTLASSSRLISQEMPITVTVPAAPRPVQAELPTDVFAPQAPSDVINPKDPVDPVAAQFLPQYRQSARGEIRLVERVCKLSKSQRYQVSLVTEKAAREASKKYGEVQQKLMQGGWQAGQKFPDARTILEEVMAPIVLRHLDAEQAVAYKDQIVRRKEDRKQVAIANIVAELDQELILTDDQRAKLRAVISKVWQEAWSDSVRMLMYNNPYFPNIPDGDITPILNDTQKQAWLGLNKTNGMMFFGFDLGLANGAVDDRDAEPVVAAVEAIVEKVQAKVRTKTLPGAKVTITGEEVDAKGNPTARDAPKTKDKGLTTKK